jgi:beta-glucanase (GH16 family)
MKPTNRRHSPFRTAVIGLAAALCVAAIVVVTIIGVERDVQSAPPPEPVPLLTSHGMTLKGAESFGGPAGSVPNPWYFDFDIGGGRGDGEKQVYTRNPENARLSGAGSLIIEARRAGNTFTSARLVTKNKISFDQGLIEARIKLPEGHGLRPTFWMRGADPMRLDYPECGEIDIIELVGDGRTYHTAIRGPLARNPSTEWTLSEDGQAKSDLSEGFHIYQVYREPGLIKVGIDGEMVAQYTRQSIPPGAQWVFDEPMFVGLDISVGGTAAGVVPDDTRFPATMEVDWIRYWR